MEVMGVIEGLSLQAISEFIKTVGFPIAVVVFILILLWKVTFRVGGWAGSHGSKWIDADIKFREATVEQGEKVASTQKQIAIAQTELAETYSATERTRAEEARRWKRIGLKACDALEKVAESMECGADIKSHLHAIRNDLLTGDGDSALIS